MPPTLSRPNIAKVPVYPPLPVDPAPLRRRKPQPPRLAWHLSGLFFLVWGLTLLRGTLSNGDAVVYLQQALEADFEHRTVHLGYLLGLSSFLEVWEKGWGALVLPILTEFRSILPESIAPPSLSTLQASQALGMNLFSLGWGLIGAWALTRLELQLSSETSQPRGPLAALIWWSFPPILASVTTGEVEGMMWGLSLVSLWGWSVFRPLTAGLALGCALTVTPAAVALLPALWCLTPQNSAQTSPQKWRQTSAWGRLFVMALVPVAFTLWWGGEDYWRGPRGLLSAPVGMSHREALELRLGQLPAAWGLWALFLVPGVSAAWTGAWPAGRRVCGALLATTLVTWAMLDRFRDIPAYGIPAALLALVVAQGVRRSVWPAPMTSPLSPGPLNADAVDQIGPGVERRPRAWKWMGLGIGVLQLVLADQAVRRERRQEADFARQALETENGSRSTPQQEGFSPLQLKAWYTTGRPATLAPAAEGHPEERH